MALKRPPSGIGQVGRTEPADLVLEKSSAGAFFVSEL
jgi:hypothetical protein